MKKIFISVVALAVSVMAMATEEAYVRVRLSGASGASSVVRLTQDNERTAEYESGYDSEKMMSQANSKSVLIYGVVGTHNCEDVVTNQLTGQKLGFVTNQIDADYTLKFENVSGTALKLYDAVTNELIDIIDNGTYAFSVEAAQVGRVDIADRFIINGTPIVSFCFNYNVLEVFGHAGESLVVKQGDTEIANVPALGGAYTLDLSDKSGRLVVTLNGTDYQIDANPAVTPVP